MSVNLRIASLGLVAALLLGTAGVIVEKGFFDGLFRIPSIGIGLILAYHLAAGNKLAFVLSVIALCLAIVILGTATVYIGTTSDLYPTWKILSCSMIVLICAISLIFLILGKRRTDQIEDSGSSVEG